MKVNNWLLALAPVILNSCNINDYNAIELYSEAHHIQAVVETPAGASHLREYCDMTRRFNILNFNDQELNGKTLPIPFNIGFLPSTSRTGNPARSKFALDVLILSEMLQTGDIIEILPIGMISIKKELVTHQRIVAIPHNKLLRVIGAENLEELNAHYAGVVKIIENWLSLSIPIEPGDSVSWQDEVMAVKFIQSMVNN